jgi:signal transduction histidine kinase
MGSTGRIAQRLRQPGQQRGALHAGRRRDQAALDARSERPALRGRRHGIGIDDQHISRLTERFYRVDKSRSRETQGTGLGLAIVKHVLLRHGGKLAIRSAPGKGSVFTASLPNTSLPS